MTGNTGCALATVNTSGIEFSATIRACQQLRVGCNGAGTVGGPYDACGVCGGDNSTCTACDGKVNSGAVVGKDLHFLN